MKDEETTRGGSPDTKGSFSKTEIKVRIFGLENDRLFCYLNAVI